MAGRSLTPFYWALALVAVGGGIFVARSAANRQPQLTSDTVAPPVTGPRGVVMGPDSAKVEIMEFSDFECPWCGRFAVLQMPDVKARLLTTGRVRWRFVNFPLSGHTKSPYAHLAASCANEQGRFWEMHDLIYQNQEDWVNSTSSERMIDGYSERVGLDPARYASCIKERRTWGQVAADKALGESLHFNGSPTFFVNGRMLPDTLHVTVDVLKRIVDSLAPATAAPATGAARPPARP